MLKLCAIVGGIVLCYYGHPWLGAALIVAGLFTIRVTRR